MEITKKQSRLCNDIMCYKVLSGVSILVCGTKAFLMKCTATTKNNGGSFHKGNIYGAKNCPVILDCELRGRRKRSYWPGAELKPGNTALPPLSKNIKHPFYIRNLSVINSTWKKPKTNLIFRLN